MRFPGSILIVSLALLSSCAAVRDLVAPARPEWDPERLHAHTEKVAKALESERLGDRLAEMGLHQLDSWQSADGVARLLPVLDPRGEMVHWARWDRLRFEVFRDRSRFQVPDFEVRLSEKLYHQPAPDTLEGRLRTACMNAKDQPLRGLRIAIDPGHMGGTEWDQRTGKWSTDHHGRVVSEGIIALETALWLEKTFQDLGAEVLLTRRTASPVTRVEYTTFQLRPFAVDALLHETRAPWFLDRVGPLPRDADPLPVVLEAPEARKLFEERMRNRYFFIRADIDARAELIRRFRPDLTLIIHFDTDAHPEDSTGLNPHPRDATKAFVIGNFTPEELASPEDRRYFAMHLLNPKAWDLSLSLSRSLVHSLSTTLQVPLDKTGGGDSTLVEAGIYARNLVLSRKVGFSAVSYLECLYYDDPTEFELLSRGYPRSERLLKTGQAIRDGVLDFMKTFCGQPRPPALELPETDQ